MAVLESVNLGRPRPNPFKKTESTGIGKEPAAGPVEVRDPGPKRSGLGSGLVGDFIGDGKHHGGHDQAVYAFQREDLDRWEERLGRDLPNGFFGENLTTSGLEVNEARVGERWRIGAEVELVVTVAADPVLDLPRLGGGEGLGEAVRRRRPVGGLPPRGPTRDDPGRGPDRGAAPARPRRHGQPVLPLPDGRARPATPAAGRGRRPRRSTPARMSSGS